jgi:nucleotide-binding universal stress UspA family protein
MYSKLYKDAMQKKIDNDILLAEKQTNLFVEKLKTRWDDVEPIIEKGHVSGKIIEKAKEEKTDLIVLGSGGLSTKKAFFLGGVSQKVATYAPCSVLVVKEIIRSLKKVLVAIDGSRYSDAAVRYLKFNFQAKEINTTILNVWDYPVTLPQFAFEAIEKKHNEEMHKVAFMAHALCVAGDPVEMITEIAHRRNMNLIVVGSKGLTGNKHFLLGSVSRKVLTHGKHSVLIVKSMDKVNIE